MSNLPWPEKRIKETHINFFKGEQHTFWPSNLLFTTDGTNHPVFSGTDDPHTELSDLKRVCYNQKWISAGGNYTDLEHVGEHDYPHTLYEILGNCSSNDYLKKEAIEWAWELLTKVYGLCADQIYVTYFGGDEKAGLQSDDETRDIWLKFLPFQRVLSFGYSDNFWVKGETGPCGPCSVIHYDTVGNRDAASLVNSKEDGSCIPIWNLVFIQFEREGFDSFKPLSSTCVDSRIGFERLTSILQQRKSSYHTDIFSPIYLSIQKATGIDQYTGLESQLTEAYRAVADHMRTLCCAIASGLQFGKEGREYSLRRLFCRTVRYGMEFLNAKEGFFNGLVHSVVGVFTELEEHEQMIKDVIRDEESSICKIMQCVLDLNIPHERHKALFQLTWGNEWEEWRQDLAPLLWHSKDTISLLLEDLASPNNNDQNLLTWHRSNHLVQILCLFNYVAEHQDTGLLFARLGIENYVYPFVKDERTSDPVQVLRKASLDFLRLYIGVDAVNHLNNLLNTGLVPCCLKVLRLGTFDAKKVMLSILEKILSKDVGMKHITENENLLFELAMGFMITVGKLVNEPHLDMLKIVIRCYLLLAKHPRARYAIEPYFPASLRNGSLIDFLAATDQYGSHMLQQLLDHLPPVGF